MCMRCVTPCRAVTQHCGIDHAQILTSLVTVKSRSSPVSLLFSQPYYARRRES